MKPALILFCLSIGLTLHAADAFLVQNGQSQAQIVLAEKPARMARLAAKELQTYVEKISGAKLEIVTQPQAGKTAVYVGKSHFTDDLKLSTEGLENGAFRMASAPGWLALLGPDEDYIPIEPWGRNRSAGETTRVNTEFDKITAVTHVAKGKNIPPFLILHVAAQPDNAAQAFRLSSLLKAAEVPTTVFAARSTDHSKLNNDLGLPDDPATKALDAFVAGLLKQ